VSVTVVVVERHEVVHIVCVCVFVALVIKDDKHIRLKYCHLTCVTVSYIFIFSHKRRDF